MKLFFQNNTKKLAGIENNTYICPRKNNHFGNDI